MFEDEKEIDLQLTGLKPVEYPTVISWDFDLTLQFCPGVSGEVFGIWTCKKVGCCKRFGARWARAGHRSIVKAHKSISRRVDPSPEEIELVILQEPAFQQLMLTQECLFFSNNYALFEIYIVI